jgi:predicted AlkP superfamily phosphohydrolase/phosphomutase
LRNEVFILGIDALDLSFLKKNITHLPNFRYFLENGIYGELDSTWPPITIPAWITMFTGKDPGKLDLYDFRKIDRETGEISLFNPLTYTKDLIWNMLPSNITRSFFNVPGSYPVDVHQADEAYTGFLSPKRQCKPSSLKKHFNEIIDETSLRGKRRIAKAINNDKIIFSVAICRPKDLTICVLRSPDVALHNEGVEEEDILQTYTAIDKLLKQIYDKNWDIFIVSDHGMKKVDRLVYLNTILENKGFLVRKKISAREEVENRLVSFANRLTQFGIRSLLKKINDLLAYKKAVDFRMNKADIIKLIDHNQTDAFAYAHSTSNYACIYVKNKHKLNEIKQELERSKYVESVKRSDEIYSSISRDTPDLLVKLKDDFIPVCLPYKSLEVKTKKYVHRKKGTFIAKGPTIKDNCQEAHNLHIEDVTPTILHLLGQKIPKDIDGRVLKEIFQEGSEPAKREIAYTPAHAEILSRIKHKLNPRVRRLNKP